jgi:hypothetical protein
MEVLPEDVVLEDSINGVLIILAVLLLMLPRDEA